MKIPETLSKCEHCGNPIDIEWSYSDYYCTKYCHDLAKAEYDGSEDDLAREMGENDFPTHPTPDPNQEEL